MVQPGVDLQSRRSVRQPRRYSPGLVALAWGAAASLAIILLTTGAERRIGPMSWYATIAWVFPLVITVQGMAGILVARRRFRTRLPWPTERVDAFLIVVVPTIGRRDTLPALTRVVTSLMGRLPQHFVRFRIDLVIEERCDTLPALTDLCAALPGTRLVVIPRDYATPAGTRFKARANQYALERREQDGDSGPDVWVLHMDDDTGLSREAVGELAGFIDRQGRAARPRHLAQGVLAYPRELSRNQLTWYADAIRPGCDLSFFAFTTGRGSPRAGLHGELLLIRSSVEAEIGWDFGPTSLVEDAQFALLLCDRYPGASEWLPAWSEGASPARVSDFVKQRERWMWGLLELIVNPVVPLRRRVGILPNVLLWALAPVANPVLLITLAWALRDRDLGPAVIGAGLLWAVNYGFYVWLYWEGFRVNELAGRRSPDVLPQWVEGLLVVFAMPLWCVLECAGILSGVWKFVRRSRVEFTVIEKPA